MGENGSVQDQHGEAHLRPFGFWTAVAFVVGGVIGGGIYVIPSQMAPLGWTGVAGWVVGGLFAVLIAQLLGAITRARPDEPGMVAMIGSVLGPLPSAMVGWSSWISYWCANAYIALTATRYAAEFAPVLNVSPVAQGLVSSGLLVALAALNLTSVRGAGRFQVVTTLLKLLPLLAVILIVLAMLPGGSKSFTQVPSFQPARDLAPAAVFGALSITMAAIVGFESAALAAQRVVDPLRNVPRATVVGTIIAVSIYVLVSTGIDFAIPAERLAGSQAPIALFIGDAVGPWSAKLVALFAVISAVGGLNVWTMLLSEIPMGLARAGLMPAWLGRTNRHDVAAAPLLLGTALPVALLLAGSWLNGAAVMDFMLQMTAVTALWLYIFAGIAAWKLGIARIRAVLAILFSLGVMAGAGAEVAALNTALLLSAIPLYLAARRTSSAAASG